MRRHDFDAAWAASDEVMAARDPSARDDPRLPYHERWVWDGRPFDGRHVLVRCYHGLGDTLQFARFLAPLRRRVASLTLEAQPELLELSACLPGPDRVVAFVAGAPAAPSECDFEIMELPHALRLAPDGASPPYLRLGAARRPGVVGLCWEAGGWDAERSVPPGLLAPLTARPCLALQPRPSALPVLNPDGCPPGILAAAEMVAGLDLVVTVDTMVAHLAGALGVPAWLLLKHGADWRWGTEARTPWYPSARLYRQPAPGDWPSAAAPVVRDFTAGCSRKARARPPRAGPAG